LLTGKAADVGMLLSWNAEHRVKGCSAVYLAPLGGVYGVFISFDELLLLAVY